MLSNHFIFCFQYFPVSGSFPKSQLFTSGGQSIGASAWVLPMNIQGWLTLGFSSVHCSVMSNSLRPHGLRHTRLSCPSPIPRACWNSCSSSHWCHPTISSCHPLLLLPSIFPSIRDFSNESVLPIRWPKYWNFSCSISPYNIHSGLISFRIDWFNLLAVQGTL